MYSPGKQHNPLNTARSLMENFARRTGLENDTGTPERRYLWTDAFALMNFTALHKNTEKPLFRDKAEKLIRLVHRTLGRFAENDSRSGWIRGAGEENSKENPTVVGLRIGKKIPERTLNERPDPQWEWERDGQYFHYHTRWINALITAGKHFENERYSQWAADLSLAGAHFIEETSGKTTIYWKMSVDLSRPLVPTRGAHDPLEGLLSAYQARKAANLRLPEFQNYISQLQGLCKATDWLTNDPLGLGGLLINVIRAAELKDDVDLPDAVRPQTLLTIAERGLSDFMSNFNPERTPAYRLAFRECGLSLGIRVLDGHRDFLKKKGIVVGTNSEIGKLADQIETFWLNTENRRERSFVDHLDINEVSLAASLLARQQPEIYCRS